MRGAAFCVVAALLAGATLTSGCELLQAPPSVAQKENVGVDPTGETIDTSTALPDTAAEKPLTASPPIAAAPKIAPAPRVTTPSRPAETPGTGSASPGDKVTASPRIPRHHHLQSSRRRSRDGGGGSNSGRGGGNSGDSGNSGE